MNTNTRRLKYIGLPVVALLLALAIESYPGVLSAQGPGGSGSAGAGAVDRDRDQIQDRDQDQDQIPDRDQDQDRDRDQVKDPATHDGDEPDQDRLQTRDQDRDVLRTTSPVDDSLNQIIYDDHQAIPVRVQDRVLSQEQLEAVIIQTRNQLQEQEKNLEAAVQNIHHNQNQVRVAATALASSSDMLGPLGPAVNRIATEYKASVQATVAAEEQIKNRSRINTFLFGGDDGAVAQLDQQYAEHQLRIQELQRLLNVWDGDPAVKDILQEQVQVLEREQARLRKVADIESATRGLFDYLLFWRT